VFEGGGGEEGEEGTKGKEKEEGRKGRKGRRGGKDEGKGEEEDERRDGITVSTVFGRRATPCAQTDIFVPP
jgi:hypothetical protein